MVRRLVLMGMDRWYIMLDIYYVALSGHQCRKVISRADEMNHCHLSLHSISSCSDECSSYWRVIVTR